MSRVLTFSRTFPAYHPKAGEPTYFVEKFYNSIFENDGDWSNAPGTTQNYAVEDLNFSIVDKKHHTIRAGHRWKKGDYFSPRVWSGRPYNSPQITIGPDTLITDVWDFYIVPALWFDDCRYKLNNKLINAKDLMQISSNDGLDVLDFMAWFAGPKMASSKRKPFDGQIICWNENIKY